MTRAEETFKAWLCSPKLIFVPKLKERYAQGRALGLSRGAVKAVLATEPELTRLRSGRFPRDRRLSVSASGARLRWIWVSSIGTVWDTARFSWVS